MCLRAAKEPTGPLRRAATTATEARRSGPVGTFARYVVPVPLASDATERRCGASSAAPPPDEHRNEVGA